jgi:hypothetical protein
MCRLLTTGCAVRVSRCRRKKMPRNLALCALAGVWSASTTPGRQGVTCTLRPCDLFYGGVTICSIAKRCNAQELDLRNRADVPYIETDGRLYDLSRLGPLLLEIGSRDTQLAISRTT